MKPFTQEHLNETVQRVAARDDELRKELQDKLQPSDELVEEQAETLGFAKAIPLLDKNAKPTREGRRLLETIVRAEAHPVLLIRDNTVAFEILSTRRRDTGTTWISRLRDRASTINGVIPAVGRVEVSNHPDYTWVGTGWLLDHDLIVTNRHVAREFARRGQQGFSFRAGLDGVSMSCTLDFLEEYERSSESTFIVESVVWISSYSDTDVAFLRLRQEPQRTFPSPVPLCETTPVEDAFIATIGYPARDNRIPDQRLVRRLFGDVYEKKRLAPGQIMRVNGDEIEHDCSTLGGNSGSLVMDLTTGCAVGLHFAGQYMTANYAVSSTKLASLIQDLKQEKLGTNPTYNIAAVTPPVVAAPATTTTAPTNGVTVSNNQVSFRLHVPLDITVGIGAPSAGVVAAPATTMPVSGPTAANTDPTSPDHLAAALAAARVALKNHPDVREIRVGYRFRQGWITDERAIVVVVREKKSIPDLAREGSAIIPNQFLNVGVDIRSEGLREFLDGLGVDTESLAPVGLEAKPGLYGEPPDLSLDLVKEKMNATFHVSPDAGFPTLKAFLGRVKSKLTATMYEWEPNHISDAIAAAIKPNRKLKLVTQYAGTHEAIADMRDRITNRMEHVWASVGKEKLIPLAYHIKVASRDDEEVWLSSGNWKKSNQPKIDPVTDGTTTIGALRDYNREWHAVVDNPTLAKLFREYIDWDFDEAKRVPRDEALDPVLPEFIASGATEEIPQARYVAPLVITNEELEIQPLLTPDRDDRERRMFLQAATELVHSATDHVYVQNQAFNLLADDGNEDAFVAFFTALKEKQDANVKIKVIFRDPREFNYNKGSATLASLLERLKDFGFDTKERIKVQWRLHTKAIMVDSKQVLLGSHNLTNLGALFNRDASLLVRNEKVTKYFEDIFEYDWKILAKQSIPESRGELVPAKPKQEAPPGARKVSLADLLSVL